VTNCSSASTIAREVDRVFYTKAGPEIGVVRPPKPNTAQLMAMYLLGIRLGSYAIP
jgi:glucosamine 6-phosphate synthetase-like amidotransferase/phosphosugar isomerase protein